MKKNEALRQFIRDNSDLSNAEGSKKYGCSKSTYASMKYRMRKSGEELETVLSEKVVPEVPVEKQLADDRKIQSLSNKKRLTDRKYKHLLEQLDEKEKLLEANKVIKEFSVFKIQPKEGNGGGHATAMLVASDWHIEEPVEPEVVDYLNEYNLQIAERRAIEFFQTSLRMLNIFEKDITIDKVVLALLGDFITGTIHDDLMESVLLSPVDALLLAERLLVSGIQFLLDNTKHDFVVACHTGNHGRMTRKQRIATEHGNSLERLMYHTIAEHFRFEDRVEVMIPSGYHSYLEIYDNFTVRLHHGHNIRYGGGVGGITIPVNKAIAQWNKARNVQLDIFGHFHQYFMGGNFICNGSMIGWNAFAIAIKGSYDRPKQAFLLIDEKRGLTITTPIVFTK